MIDKLTKKQIEIIERAEGAVSPNALPDFKKFLADVLRGKRELSDADVRHACGAALVRYEERCA